MHVMAFVACWTPYLVISLWHILGKMKSVPYPCNHFNSNCHLRVTSKSFMACQTCETGCMFKNAQEFFWTLSKVKSKMDWMKWFDFARYTNLPLESRQRDSLKSRERDSLYKSIKKRELFIWWRIRWLPVLVSAINIEKEHLSPFWWSGGSFR